MEEMKEVFMFYFWAFQIFCFLFGVVGLFVFCKKEQKEDNERWKKIKSFFKHSNCCHEWVLFKIKLSKYNWWYDERCKLCGRWKNDLWNNQEEKIKWESENILKG